MLANRVEVDIRALCTSLDVLYNCLHLKYKYCTSLALINLFFMCVKDKVVATITFESWCQS